jgi:hypothetical protein
LNYPISRSIQPLVAKTITRAQTIAAPTRVIESRNQSDWRIQIAARQGGLMDTDNSIGVAPDAKDGFDNQYDAQKPPMVQAQVDGQQVNSVYVGIDGIDERGRAASFADSVRSTSGSKTWSVSVSSTQDGEVTMFWPNISRLPRGLDPYLVDTMTGKRIPMRSSSSYRYVASSRAAHRFQIDVVPSKTRPLALLNTRVSGGGKAQGVASYRVSVTTSQTADVDVEFRTFSGRTLRHLQTRALANTESSVVWDGKDTSGASLPIGAYQLILTARDQSGNVVRRMLPLMTTR